MTKKQKIIDYLEREPLFRERKNKDKGIVNLLRKQYRGLDEALLEHLITKDEVVAMLQDYAALDRAWRQALEKREDLRGSDYDDKAELEKEAQRSLGYNV